MDIVSPLLPATTLLWQPRAGQWAVTLICKATYQLAPADSKLASDQEGIVDADQYWDDDPDRSLLAATDLVPVKPRVDVVLVGHAFAPSGQKVRRLTVRLRVGAIDKSLGVVADRTLSADGAVAEDAAFSRMPIAYERAAGGAANPVGRQLAHGGASLLPNLVALTSAGGDPFGEPVGLGPVAPHWPQRRALAAAAKWSGDLAAGPLPEGLDFAYFNVAPPDQQLDHLPLGAPLGFENLHPEHASWTTQLPAAEPRGRLERAGGGVAHFTLRADTLCLDVGASRATVTWRGTLPIDGPTEGGRVVVTFEPDPMAWGPETTAPMGLPGGPASSPSPFQGGAAPIRSRARTALGTNLSPVASLPFVADARAALSSSSPGWGPSPPQPPQPASALPFASNPLDTRGLIPSEPRMALPHAPPLVPPAPPAPPAPPSSPGGSAPHAVVDVPRAFAPMPPMPPMSPPMAPMPPMSPPIVAAPVSVVAAPLPPARIGVQHAPGAGYEGLVSASNAAAEAKPGRAGSPSVALPKGEPLDLLWFDPEALPRMKRVAEWKKIFDRLEDVPPDRDEPAAEGTGDAEDRREVFEVLARGIPANDEGFARALEDGVRPDGRFAARLVLLAGELQLDFDELETLKATLSVAQPHATRTKDLEASTGAAASYVSTPALLSAPQVARELTARIRAAFAQWPERALPATHLEDLVQRVLLEKRSYERREVFGDTHLLGRLFLPGSSTGIPAYLPESLAKKLPLFRRFKVRLVAEAHPQADEYEESTAALRPVAIARSLSR